MRRPSWLAGPLHPEGDACVAPTACLRTGLIVCVKMNHQILVGPHNDPRVVTIRRETSERLSETDSRTLPAMSPEPIAIITAAVAIIGFPWNLHRDVADLRERMVRLEGLFEGFTRSTRATPPPARG